jgi:hypothetical protein
MRHLVTSALSAALVVCAAAEARAQSATTVFNIEVEGVDASLTPTLTAILRNEAQQLEGYEVINKSPVSLNDLVIVLGCDTASLECLEQAAKQVNSSMLIYGSLVKEKDGLRLKVDIYDSKVQRVTFRLQKLIGHKEDIVVTYRSEIEQFIRSVRQQKDAPKLVVNANVRGALVKLNGEDAGTIPFEREGLKPGNIDIEVSAQGFSTWSASMELTPGNTTKVNASLKPIPKEVGAKTPGEDKLVVSDPNPRKPSSSTTTGHMPGDQLSSPNWGAWSLVGLGTASLIGSGVTAILMKGTEDEIRDKNLAGTLTPDEYDQLVARGNRYQTTHRVMLGIGLVGVAAGGVWLLVDALSASNERSAATPMWDLHFGPTSVEALIRW